MDSLQQEWHSYFSQVDSSSSFSSPSNDYHSQITSSMIMMISSGSGTSTPSSGSSMASRPVSPAVQEEESQQPQQQRGPQQVSLPRATTEYDTGSTSSSTVTGVIKQQQHTCHQPQMNRYGNPVSPLERQYPKPDEELDIAEALSRKPLKHTFSHHVQSRVTRETGGAGGQRNKMNADEMERRKRELLGFHSELNSKLGGR